MYHDSPVLSDVEMDGVMKGKIGKPTPGIFSESPVSGRQICAEASGH